MLQRPKAILVGLLEKFVVIVLLLMVLFVFAGIIARFILRLPLVWGEELALIGQIWLTFMSASLLCASGEHMVVDVILNFMSERRRLLLAIVNQLITIPLFIAFIVGGLQVVEVTYLSITPGLGVSVAIMYIPAVLGGLIMLLFSVDLLIVAIRDLRSAATTGGAAAPGAAAGGEQGQI